MKKYDCNKTLDYAHELNRMCEAYECNGCPFDKKFNCNDSMHLSQKNINIVQKWSDEHPEPPKLTKKERTFLECFNGFLDERTIRKIGEIAMYCYDESSSYLKHDMFTFLESGYSMTFEELLKLEVEE